MTDLATGAELVLPAADPAGAHPASLPGVAAVRVEEFQGLYFEHYERLSSYCASLVGDRAAGAELAQEAFTRLFARWRSVRQPRAWLYYVGTTLAMESWRRRDRDRALVARLAERDRLAPRPADHAWLQDVVDRLPPRLREVVLLHYYADLPIAEIARLTHRPLGTVKRRLHEARNALADMLEEER